MKNQVSYGRCLYRLPGKSVIHDIAGPITFFENSSVDRGFIMAPFEADKQSLMLEIEEEKTFTDADLDAMKWEISPIPQQNQPTTTKKEYLKLTRKAIGQIENGSLKKVVTARCVNLKFSDLNCDFNILSFFSLLCRQYPNMFVYLWHDSMGQTWMGATPELLFSQTDVFAETVALAGTKSIDSVKKFSRKENDEQKWVLRYLQETLSTSDVMDVTVNETQEIAAGPLSHLVTPVSFSLNVVSQRWGLLNKLHPTPAVGGYPKEDSIAFIKENEPIERGFYSGYLGPFDKTTARFFVNIRCMQITEKNLLLYAGAGITAQSEPEAEWEETEKKLETLKRLLE